MDLALSRYTQSNNFFSIFSCTPCTLKGKAAFEPLSLVFSEPFRTGDQAMLEARTDLELEAFDFVAILVVERRRDTELQRA